MTLFPRPFRFFIVIAVMLSMSGTAWSQACREALYAGGTETIVSGRVVTGSSAAATAVRDGVYYEVSSGTSATPYLRVMYSDQVQTAPGTVDPDPIDIALYGVSVVNPTSQPLVISQVLFSADADHFTLPNVIPLRPVGGTWSVVSPRLLRWVGAETIAAGSAADFVVSDSPRRASPSPRTARITASAITNTNVTYAAAAFSMTAVTSSPARNANATVTFDPNNDFIPVPRLFVAAPAGPVSLPIRVAETGNNGASTAIAPGLQLHVTIPAGWSSVSVPTLSSPWSSVTIVQPTASTEGRVTVTTNRQIDSPGVTPRSSLVLRATPPSSPAETLFPFKLRLEGRTIGNRPPAPLNVLSVNESVVQIPGTPSSGGGGTVHAEFLSPSLTAGPVRRLDFRADFNVISSGAAEDVAVEAFRASASTWTRLATVRPAAQDAVVTASFSNDYDQYLIGGRMRIRFVTGSVSPKRLAVDYLEWKIIQGYTVDSARGLETNPGHIAAPFRTLAPAMSALGAAGAVYVDAGLSRLGTPYTAGFEIPPALAGSAGCKTAVFAVSTSGQRPLIDPLIPSNGPAFTVRSGAHHVAVEGFEIRNMGIGLSAGDLAGPTTHGTLFINNIISTPDFGVGINLVRLGDAVIRGNHIHAASSTGALHGIFERSGNNVAIEGNRISGHSTGMGIYSFGSSGVSLLRNIATGNDTGIHVAHASGRITLYHNTVDRNLYMGIYSESNGDVVSRNNIVTRNATFGWRSKTAGGVSSSFDNVWSNGNDYSNVVGTSNLSVDPLFYPATDPHHPDYYRLGPGSPCLNAGTTAGPPPVPDGRPDLGAVEN